MRAVVNSDRNTTVFVTAVIQALTEAHDFLRLLFTKSAHDGMAAADKGARVRWPSRYTNAVFT